MRRQDPIIAPSKEEAPLRSPSDRLRFLGHSSESLLMSFLGRV
jgi:hypothetical protein